MIAQQDPHYSQYMFNPLGVNAGYTGSREALSLVMLHRSQWVGFDGPKHSNIGTTLTHEKQKHGLRFNTNE